MIWMIIKRYFGRLSCTASIKKAQTTIHAGIFAINPNHSAPSSSFIKPMNASNPTFVVRSSFRVVLVELYSRVAKVIPPVVVTNSINVIDMIGRKAALNIQKCKPMVEHALPVDRRSNIPVLCNRPSYISSFSIYTSGAFVSYKQTSIRIISKEFFQSFLGYTFNSHVITSISHMVRGLVLSIPVPRFYHNQRLTTCS